MELNYLVKLASIGISGLASFFILAVVPDAIGPAEYGIFTFCIALATQYFSLWDAGSSNYLYVEMCKNNKNYFLISTYLLFSFCVLFLTGIILAIIYYAGLSEVLFPSINFGTIMLASITGFFLWVFQLAGKIGDAQDITIKTEFLKVFQKVVLVSVIMMLIANFGMELDFLFITYIFSNLMFVVIFYLFIASIPLSSFTRLNLSIIMPIYRDFLKFTKPLLSYTVIGFAAAYYDLWLLQSTSGPIQTGYYGFCFAFVSVAVMLSAALSPILTREFSRLLRDKYYYLAIKSFQKSLMVLVFGTQLISFIIYFSGDVLVSLVAGEKFISSVPVLSILAFYPLFQALNQVGSGVLYSTGDTRFYSFAGNVGYLIGFVLSYYFISFLELEALGLALKLMVTQFIVSFVFILRVGIILGKSFFTFYLRLLFVFLCHFLFAYFYFNIFDIFDIRDLFQVSVLFVVFSVVFLLFFPGVFLLCKDDLRQLFIRFGKVFG